MNNKSIPSNSEQMYYLPLLLGAFANKVETEFDKQMEEITWKQYLLIKTLKHYETMPREKDPNLVKLADSLGSSYQNIKEIVIRLENKGFITIVSDDNDKKKQRIVLTERSYKYLEYREEKDRELFKKVTNGISSKQLYDMIDTITQIDNNLAGTSLIRIKTWEGNEIEASHFRICKILPRLKNQPKYQLYASRGSAIQVSGINRHIIGFYDNEKDIQQEIDEINEARQKHKSEYTVKHWCHVSFTKFGTVVKSKP